MWGDTKLIDNLMDLTWCYAEINLEGKIVWSGLSLTEDTFKPFLLDLRVALVVP